MPQVHLAVFHKSMGMSDFGYIIPPEKRQLLNLPLKLNHKRIPARSCLHTIMIADENFSYNPQPVFQKAIDYARSRHLEVGSMIWGEIILVEVEEQAKLHPYIELWISINI